MPNDYLDQVQVGGTTYDLQDTAAQEDLSQLKSQISDIVVDDTKDNANKVLVKSKNIVVFSEIENGKILNDNNGSVSDNPGYRVTGFCQVNPGDVMYSNRSPKYACFYKSDKTYLSKITGMSANTGYTVPENACYARFCTTNRTDNYLSVMVNDDSGIYQAYFDPYYVYKSEQFVYSESHFFRNLLDITTHKYGEDENYYYFKMPAIAGKTYYFYLNVASYTARIAFSYDLYGNQIAYQANTTSYQIASTGSELRLRVAKSTDITKLMVTTDQNPPCFIAYGDEKLKNELLPIDITPALHVYLPSEICVGIGRTIELYNDLVCIEANKYHLRWSGSVGVQYERKYSITGVTAGQSSLTLKIYDDRYNLLWQGATTVKVVANSISSSLKVVPIGDSLTNLKPWLSEVQTLSNNKIQYIGTRGRSDNTIRHEGRSGFTAAEYLTDTEYTFDENYQGNPNVQGSVNPFWNGTRFSLSYYNEQQAATVGIADAVEILLGTNDVFSNLYTSAQCAEHITDIIDNIRQDDANIPIFVCNTIYRSNQNGYYSSGGQGFTAASGWAFDSDMKIMEFQNALATAIAAKNYTSVYVVPCSVCMDRDNDYGQVEVAVNPRLSDVTESIPSESVHPQNAGYYQMADVMYSSFIAHLS